MASAIFAKENYELKKMDTSTATVPDYDVCKVSYYLRCIDIGCGLDLIKDKKLLEYKNAHRLSRERQDTIFKLGWHLYDHENVLGKVVFLEPELLPSGKSNEFYELKNVTSVLGVIASEALIAGQQTTVHKIMVCNMNWLTKNYQNPLNRNKSRVFSGPSQGDSTDQLLAGLLALASLAGTLTEQEEEEAGHCSHCRGLAAGDCACKYGCPRNSSTKCTIVVEDPDNHCSHCKGLNGPCSCVHGCLAKSESQCKVVHSGVICDGCHSSAETIEGPRYKCNVCDNFDLCGDCYEQGKHNNTHAFQRIARVGSRPVLLEPRRKETPTPTAPPAPPPYNPTATAIPVSTSSDVFGKQDPPSYPSTPTHIPTVTAIPVTPDTGGHSIFAEGTTVQLTGLTNKPELNGQYGVVAHSLGGGKVVVHIAAHDKKMIVKEANLEVTYSPIPIGALVELMGLKSSQENGKLGQIRGYNPRSGRMEVQILGGDDLKSIKPENLVVVEDAI